ncbi:hypothetical protein Aperf_G00000107542 [Anoplocephala perfoliata]
MSNEQLFATRSFQPFVQCLYDHLRNGYENSNLFFSPLSVYSGLSLALCGASGQTQNAISQVLNVQNERSKDHEAILKHLGGQLDAIFAGDNLHTLVQANGLFTDDGLEVNSHFKQTMEKYFHANSRSLDFSKSEEARRVINQWVEKNTANKIKELMSSDSIDADTKLVLANAIYFKGSWKKVFRRECTRDAPFYTLSGKEITVPMMSDSGIYKVAELEALKVSLIKIPFKCHEMVVAVPHEQAGLPKLLEYFLDKSHPERFKEIFQNSHYNDDNIELLLPKFKLGAGAKSLDLKEPVSQMGLADIFDPHRADFKRISTTTKLGVTSMVHKAMIEVNEEGAEAAAATGVAAVAMALLPCVVVDHPFFFFIVTDSGFPVFAGHVTNPLEE